MRGSMLQKQNGFMSHGRIRPNRPSVPGSVLAQPHASSVGTYSPQLRRSCACGGKCSACQGSAQSQILRSSTAQGPEGVAPAVVHEVLRSPGQPLSEVARANFEQQFGHSFSNVEVHTGAKAAASAEAVNALAYTVGRHVVLGAGMRPSHQGEHGKLMAHELAHVMQWGQQSIPAHLPVAPANGAAEQAAHAREQEAGRSQSTQSLQRAARVCDEYRQQDSASVVPGPGISVNVSRSGKSANVSADLQVHGAEADAAKASTIQSTIASNWNGAFPDGYHITTRVNATYRGPTDSENSSATQIELVRSGGRPNYVTRSWLVGSRYMQLNLDHSYSLTWSAAHEFGHLLGLDDHYSEGILSSISRTIFGGTGSSTVDPGYENNIMGARYGVLESRNVQDLIDRHATYECVRWRLENPL